MLAVNEPVGRYVALAKLDQELLPLPDLESQAGELLELITAQLSSNRVSEVAQEVLKPVFDLRYALLVELAHQNIKTTDFLGRLAKYTAVNLQMAPFSELSATVADVLLAYENIVGARYTAESLPLKAFTGKQYSDKPSYNTLRLLDLHPSPQVRYVKKWIDASLFMEVGLIIAGLLQTGQLKLPDERIIEELIPFLRTQIDRFGAYSIFTGFWTPADDDRSTATNRMKILAATLELDLKKSSPVSTKGLMSLLEE